MIMKLLYILMVISYALKHSTRQTRLDASIKEFSLFSFKGLIVNLGSLANTRPFLIRILEKIYEEN